MKNLKTTVLFLFALIMSASVHAGDNKSENKTAGKAKSSTVYFWFNPAVNAYQASNTTADEEARTGCIESDVASCEKGYTSSQLINPSNPSQGVKPAEINQPAASLQLVE